MADPIIGLRNILVTNWSKPPAPSIEDIADLDKGDAKRVRMLDGDIIRIFETAHNEAQPELLYDYVNEHVNITIDVRTAQSRERLSELRDEVRRILYAFRKGDGTNFDRVIYKTRTDLSDRTKKLFRYTLQCEVVTFASLATSDDVFVNPATGAVVGSTTYQTYDGDLAAIANLTPTDGHTIIGNGTTWVTSAVTGDITGVTAGTGLSGGGASGAVTLNVAGLTISEFAANTIQLSSESFADNNTSLMTSAAIADKIESYGYTTQVGDITGVTAGSGLTGGGTSGTVTVSLDLKDEDNMASDSATHAASQQSIKAYVDSEVTSLIDSAPGALNTLNELAAALNDDASFSSTITTSIGTKLAKASNLSDVANAVTARGNLGLGSLSTLSSIDISSNTNLAASAPIVLTGDTLSLADPANLSELNESTDATDDKILLWDESGSAWKYMTLDNLQDSIDTSSNDTNTTYSISTAVSSDDANIVLTDSSGTTDTVKIAAGTNISVSHSTDTITLAATNTQLSTEAVQDIIGSMVDGGTETRIGVTYDDTNGKINFVVDDMTADTNTFRTVTAGGNTLGASETLAFTAGSNVSISESGGAVTIASTDTNTTYSVGDGGLTQNNFTNALKTKLDGIEASADVTDAASVKSALGGAMGSNALQIGDGSTTTTFPGSIVITGTTTTNHVETVSTSNGVVFEGSNADDNEVTLKAATVSADRTITLPDATGTVALTSQLTSDTNTQNVFTSSFVDSTNDILLRLTKSGASSGTQDIKFVAGTNVTLTHTDANNITIASTDTNTEYSVGDGGLTQNNFTNTLKSKLDGIAASANNYVHPNHSGEVTSTADGATVIASNVVDEDNLKATNSPTDNHLLSYDQSTGGFTWVAAGAGGENNQNAFSTVAVSGQDDVVADAATDTLTFAAGSNITLTTNASSDTVTIASADTNTTTTADVASALNASIGADFNIGTTASHKATFAGQVSASSLIISGSSSDTNVGTLSWLSPQADNRIWAFPDHSGSVLTTNDIDKEWIQDVVGEMFASNTETRISATYVDGGVAAGKINLVVDDMTANDNTFRTVTAGGNTLGASETLAFTAGSNVTITESGGAVTIASTDTNTNTQLSTEQVQDIVGGMLVGTETRIGVTYDDTNGRINFVVDDMTANTQLTLLDEDNFLSNSATAAASQQSIKAYVDAEVSGLVDSAPNTLNTLNELAAALGDDASFATTTATSLGEKLVKASNLSDLPNAGTARSNLGLGTASTLAGDGAVANGNAGLVTGDVVFDYIAAQGFGTGAGDITAVVAGTGLSGGATSGSATVNLDHLGIQSLSDPGADRLLIWDDSAGAIVFATPNDNLAISGTNVNATDTNTNTFRTITAGGNTLGSSETLAFTAGSNVTITESGGAVTIASSNASLSSEEVQDIVGAMFSSNTETGIAATYQDGDGTIDLNTTGNKTLANSVQLSGASTTNFRVTTGAAASSGATLSFVGSDNNVITNLTIPSSSGTISLSDTQLSTEQVQDIVGAMFSSNTETRISATYQDGDGTIDLVVDDMTTDTNTFRTVTAGGNTLGSTETLAFTAGSNVTISESGGAVTIAATDTNTQLTLKDEDDMASNSATAAASQQSIKAYVDAEVSGLVDSAPSALNTLNELAAALGDDASFSSTVSTSLGNRLRVDVNNQGLNGTQQGNARTNLGLGAAALKAVATDGSGGVADGEAGLVTGNAVFDYIDAQGFGAGSGDITAVVAGTGLSGGATSGSATVNLSHLGIESLSDPGADRLLIWDDSAGAVVFATPNSNLAISGTNVNATDTNTQLTTEAVQDIVGAMFSSNTETRIAATYQDGDGTIDLVVDDMTANDNTFRTVTAGGNTLGSSETLAFTAGSNVTITESGGAVTIASTDTNTNTQLSTEQVQDIVGAMFSSNTETRIAATYQDGDGTIDLVVDDMTANDNTFRTITAGGNTLGASETLAFTAGSNVTISESSGAVTIASTDTNTEYSVGDGGLTQNNFTNTLKSKLDGIEASATADQTASEVVALLNDIASYSLGTAGSGTIAVNHDMTVAGDLTVTGTTITSNVETVSTSNGVQFEGSAANTNEILLKAGTVSADRTITLPDATGTVALTSQLSDTTYSAGTNISLSGTTFNVDDAFLKNDANDTTSGTITAGGFTTAGSITLGGHAFNDIDIGSEFVDTDDHIMSSGAIKEKIEAYSYITASSSDTLSNKTIAISQVTELSNLTAAEGEQLENIGSVTISNAQWGYLGAATGAITNTDTNTQNEYATSFVDSSNDIILRLTESGAGSGTQDIKFVAGSNVTLTHTDANNITIASTDTNTNTTYSAGTNISLSGTTFNVDDAFLVNNANDTTSGVITAGGFTTAGSITLGGHAFNDIDIGSEFVDTDDHIMSSGAIKAYVDANAGGIASLADDSSPQLGGDLDTNGSEIVSTSNQHISITPHGTGDIQLNADTIRVGDSNADVTIAPNISSTTAKLQFQSDGDTLLRTASGTGNMYLNANSLMSMQAATFRFGISGGNPTLTTLGTSDLTLNTNSGTNSGSIVIADGANSDISITPNGTGDLVLDGLKWPQADGTANYVLKTDGSAQLSWVEMSSGGASAIGDLSDAITTATSNIGLGSGALDSLTASSGNWNTAVGINAGTSVTTGDANVFMGLNAGQYVSTGGTNIGIGKSALERGSTEHNNIAIGSQAMGGAYGQSATGASNIALGNDALRYGAQSNGGNNIAIGSKALYGSNGNSSGANYNIGIGIESLEAITTGDYNVGLGYKTLEANTTGTRNIAIGANALDAADTESDNIAIGYDALGGAVAGAEKTIAIGNYAADAVTTADNLIAIGYNAAGSLTTGYNNTADSVYIGNEAGASITNGGSNVVVGHQAGANLSTYSSGTLRCSYNVLLGYQAGQYSTIGGRNVAIGTRSMWLEQETGYNTYVGNYTGLYARGAEKNTALGYGAIQGQSNYLTGDKNTGLGYNALSYISSGADNIAIGCEAGDNITTGSNNVVIGKADVPSATGSDQLSISSGDGGVTWITGDSNGGIASKAKVVAVSSGTTLTEAQSGSYIYWTAGTLTLPANATVGTQFTIFNNSGGSGTVGLGTNNSIVSGGASNAAVADNDSTSYICVSATNWWQVG